MKKYFVKGAEKDYGPYSVDELRARQVDGGTFVREDGSDAWVEAFELPDFKSVLESAPLLTEGMHWGDITPKECNGSLRMYSAILWDIPDGQSWETACAAMPANILGLYFPHPARCLKRGYMWGEWDVYDGSCGGPPPPPPPPQPGTGIPQCVFKELSFLPSKVNHNGQTYPALLVNIYVKRTLDMQGNSCRCPEVSFANRLAVRLLAFENTPTNPAQGTWVFRNAKTSNEFSFGAQNDTGATQQINPLFVPVNPGNTFFFEAEFFLKGNLGSKALPVAAGQIATTPRGGIRVPRHP